MAAIADHCLDFPDLSPALLVESGLADRDAALMHAVYDAAVRRWTTLEWIVSSSAGRDSTTLDPVTRAGLLAGAAQLMLLDRLPDHAVIDRSVEWVKGHKGKGAAGLVNAVLRRVAMTRAVLDSGDRETRAEWTGGRDEIPLGDGKALVLRHILMPADPLERISVSTGVNRWLIGRWAQRMGIHEARRLAWHSLTPAPVVLNAVQATSAIEFPAAAGGTLVLRKHDRAGHLCVEGSRAALVRFLDARADLWVQDPSSSEAIESVRGLSPGLIVDLCAGQGTKTRQLAAVFPAARIVATDVDPRRLATLKSAVAGMDRVQVVDSCDVEKVVTSGADLVLIDVPCSNTGVLARRIEARHRAGKEQLERLGRIQEAILDRAGSLRARGGKILYATCSIEPEENEEQVGRAADRLGLKVRSQRSTLPTGGPGVAPTSYSDGSFSAIIGEPADRQTAGVHSASR